MLKNIRAFFNDRGVLEVETPLLSSFATTDPNLQSFSTRFSAKPLYLNTSPEYHMKRLLAAYGEAIFQVCKAFRDEELGPNHQPEFTMLEWYRPGFDMFQLMDEVEQLVWLLVSEDSVSTQAMQRLSYAQAFKQYAGINPHLGTASDCLQCALDNNIEQPVGLDDDVDEWLDWLLTQLVLPSMPSDTFTFIYDYPQSQCALARLRSDENGQQVAARFELFYGEYEIANGFHELQDAEEQRLRFKRENEERVSKALAPSAMDEQLLAALDHGLPDCSGVALGIDRLLMLLTKSHEIEQVISFALKRD
jgi:lysyl-tRNA synthetase class 2